MGGSYGRRQAGAQMGYQDGNWSAYVNADAINDNGWRDFSSASQLRRLYADVGARNDTTEFHINFTGADNKLGSVAATPLDMLSQRWSSVYTWPQTTHLQLAFATASLNYAPTDNFAVQSNTYFRGFWQAHVDGNGTDAQPCDPGGALAGQLCIGDGQHADQHELLGDRYAPGERLPRRDRPQLDLDLQLRRHRPGDEHAAVPRSPQSFRDGHEPRSRPHPVHQRRASSAPSTRTCSCKAPASTSTSRPTTSPRSTCSPRTPTPASTRPTRSTSPTSSRSPPARGSTSPRSTCSTRPSTTRCSTARAITSASTR